MLINSLTITATNLLHVKINSILKIKKLLFSETKKLVRRVSLLYMLVNLCNVWLIRRYLDSHICFCS